MSTKFQFFTIFLFLLGFNLKAQSHTSPLQREWMLISFKEYKKDFLVQAKASLKFETLKSAHAKMGCNTLNFTVNTIKNKKIIFGEGISTMMYCEDYMTLEKDFSTSLMEVCKYQIKGHFLTLSDKKGRQMKFVAADWD